MYQFHKIWIDQCKAARNIREEWGLDKALGYLIGEKLITFIETADSRPEFAAELPKFAAEIKSIFERHEIEDYLDNVRRIGPLAHTCTDEEYEQVRHIDVHANDPVYGAEQILLLQRAREMLLD
ncbi:MAG: hypothetical protein AB1486_00610 [Planctomycetota bacterium]